MIHSSLTNIREYFVKEIVQVKYYYNYLVLLLSYGGLKTEMCNLHSKNVSPVTCYLFITFFLIPFPFSNLKQVPVAAQSYVVLWRAAPSFYLPAMSFTRRVKPN